VEPFFTFTAHIPPCELRRLTVRQIRDHLMWWEDTYGPFDTVTLGG
jgi:hypothetical protein